VRLRVKSRSIGSVDESVDSGREAQSSPLGRRRRVRLGAAAVAGRGSAASWARVVGWPMQGRSSGSADESLVGPVDSAGRLRVSSAAGPRVVGQPAATRRRVHPAVGRIEEPLYWQCL
jgi:hypothetical protein